MKMKINKMRQNFQNMTLRQGALKRAVRKIKVVNGKLDDAKMWEEKPPMIIQNIKPPTQ